MAAAVCEIESGHRFSLIIDHFTLRLIHRTVCALILAVRSGVDLTMNCSADIESLRAVFALVSYGKTADCHRLCFDSFDMAGLTDFRMNHSRA